MDTLDDSDAIKMLGILESVSLQQHVVGPTHVRERRLDLAITCTRQSGQIVQSTSYVDRYLSDHASLPSLSVRTVSYSKWKSVDVEAPDTVPAKSDLSENPSADLDELVSCYHNTLRAAEDTSVPLKTKTIVVRPRVPRYNDDITQVKRARRQAQRKWRRWKSHSDFAYFKAKRNAVNNPLNKVRREFAVDFVEENSCDQRKLSRASKRLFNQPPDDGLPPKLHAPTFANDVERYFGTIKVELIQQKINTDAILSGVSNVSVHELTNEVSTPLLSAFENLADTVVKSLFQHLALKYQSLLSIITTIINKSLQNGSFSKC